ncbi:DEAD/DEAH box helicase family protein, partial [Bacteroides cellulosilyticus]
VHLSGLLRILVAHPDWEILPINPLNDHQKMAYDEIVRSFQSKNVCLLHGVTASGKTEIYIHLIEETIRQGKQVLYLLLPLNPVGRLSVPFFLSLPR